MKFNDEIWKDIKGYETYYCVSNLGRVKRLEKTITTITPHKGTFNKTWKGRILKTKKNNYYSSVDLCKNNKVEHKSIHRLAAEAFIPNPENKPQINHKNGIKSDNRVENLEWCTASENGMHAYKILKRVPPRNAPIVCIETGKRYSKMLEAQKETGILITSICNNLAGRSSQAGGLHWKRG